MKCIQFAKVLLQPFLKAFLRTDLNLSNMARTDRLKEVECVGLCGILSVYTFIVCTLRMYVQYK